MGYRTIFTDHSLFGFDDMAGIHLNKLQKLIFSDLDHAICVSHTGRENL
jgi:phosphatidylinositol glycan class A protein